MLKTKLATVSLASLLWCAGAARALADAPAPGAAPAAPTQETLFDSHNAGTGLGWYIAPSSGFTTVSGDFAYVWGLRGVLTINRQFGIGLAGNLLGTPDTHLGDHDAREVGAYGGIYAQYILHSGKLVHAYADTTFGSGAWCQQSVNDDCDGDYFGFIEPTANLELNLAKNLRVAAGLGYRFALAEDGAALSSRDLSGVIVRTSLVVGMF